MITGWPQCFVCKKPVEQVIHQPENGFIHNFHTFTAVCHGEREDITIPTRDLVNADSVDIGGVAFQPELPQLQEDTYAPR